MPQPNSCSVITQSNRPLAFFSRKLSVQQQKYSVTKIELLAIVETLKEFKGMLWGQHIKVYTDYKNLTRDASDNVKTIHEYIMITKMVVKYLSRPIN